MGCGSSSLDDTASRPVSSTHANKMKAQPVETGNKPSALLRMSSLHPNQTPPAAAEAVVVQVTQQVIRQMSEREMAAIQKIQKGLRRSKALKRAHAENQWKIFADLDTRDESDTLHLASFMQTLLDKVPGGAGGVDEETTRRLSMKEEDHSTSSLSSSSSSSSSSTKEEGGGGGEQQQQHIDMNQIEVSVDAHVHGEKDNFECPHDITPQVASAVLDLFRAKGRLSLKSVQRIMKQTYRILQTVPNVVYIDVPEGGKMTIVGDIHGQLNDLLFILEESGFPSAKNLYVFNGDFVDRGENGVEVICLLFALYAAFPAYVVLNRGNHEDEAVCRTYGFYNECTEKYDEMTTKMFLEVFRYLPPFTVVSDTIFIVHGGLFHDENVKLSDLQDINRRDYVAVPPVPYPECVNGFDEAPKRKEYLKQLLRDALWSDPRPEQGQMPNPRGAGISFGPDVCAKFLANNKLSMVIRSHECVKLGVDFPYSRDVLEDFFAEPEVGRQSLLGGINMQPMPLRPEDPLLCTIFSASNYSDNGNEGAYIVVMPHKYPGSNAVGSKGLSFSMARYKTTESSRSLASNNKSSLTELLVRKRRALFLAFEAEDPQQTGVVSRSVWAEVMARVTTLKILWLSIIKSIAPAECLENNTVAYGPFLNSFKLMPASAVEGEDTSNQLMDVMYAQRKKLETIFYFFDTDGDGVISREEFNNGCNLLNSHLPPDSTERLTDIQHMMDLIDIDHSGSIDLNEFMETFRILDAKDGKVDGVLGLAQKRSSKKQP